MKTLLVAQAMSTFSLTGLIWLVQLVHYPGFAHVDADRFPDFHKMHTTRITVVVAPLMLVELVTTVAWCFQEPQRVSSWVGLALVGTIWASTAFVQVPLHDKLSRQWSRVVADRLVRTNWVRTLAWTARSVLVAALLLGL